MEMFSDLSEDNTSFDDLLDTPNCTEITEENKNKDLLNISFSGGGFKGAAFVGCVKALYQNNILNKIQCVAGSSAGALVAALIACKADFNYIKSCAVGVMKHFEKYRSLSWYNILSNAKNITEDYGIYNTDELRNYFSEVIMNATNSDKDLTFLELYNMTNIKLIISAACLNSKTPFYFSHETTKDTSISEALSISVNIPLLFTGKKFRGKTLVDGCVIENLPMQCWTDDELENTMAFLVQSKNEYYNNEDNIKNVYDYVEGLYASMKAEKETWYYEKYKEIIVLIMAGNISAYKKIPTKTDLQTVIHSAYFQTIEALEQRSFLQKENAYRAGFVSSLIISDGDDESESEDYDQPPLPDKLNIEYTERIKMGYKLLTLFIIILISLSTIRLFKKI